MRFAFRVVFILFNIRVARFVLEYVSRKGAKPPGQTLLTTTLRLSVFAQDYFGRSVTHVIQPPHLSTEGGFLIQHSALSFFDAQSGIPS
jgi:hypothetical protein